MIYTQEIKNMCPVAQGVHHGAAPCPTEGNWVQYKEIKDISGFTHGIGWCAPQQGACKLSLNVKNGVIQEALVETIGCSGMTHSAAMAAEILPVLDEQAVINAAQKPAPRKRTRIVKKEIDHVYSASQDKSEKLDKKEPVKVQESVAEDKNTAAKTL